MTVLFYTSFRHIVGSDVIKTMKDFFLNDRLSPAMNHTNLVLIPKVDNASKVGQFRPISLCNVCYKLISKILTEWLKPIMWKLIFPYQLAFIPGRVIQDNFIVVAEIFHAMVHKKGNEDWMEIKANIEKAYDRVEWSFILKVL